MTAINHNLLRAGDLARFSGDHSVKIANGKWTPIITSRYRDGIITHMCDEIQGALMLSEGKEYLLDFESRHTLEIL